MKNKPIIPITNLESFKVRISQIPPFDVAFKEMALTDYENLVAVIYRLNELIGINQKYIDLTEDVLEWVMNDGISESVLLRLNEWLNDGTLENLINETLLNMKLDKSEFEDYKLLVNQTLQGLKQNIQSIIDGKISRIDDEISRITTQLTQITLNVKDFGLVGDGVTDDTSKFTEMINFATNNGLNHITIPKDMNIAVGDVLIPEGFTIEGGGSVSHINDFKVSMILTGDSTIKNIHFHSTNLWIGQGNLEVRGENNTIQNSWFNDREGDKSHSNIILSNGSHNTTIVNNVFKNGSFMVNGREGSKNILITGNYFSGGTTKGTINSVNGGYAEVPIGDAVKLTGNGGGSKVIITNNIFDGVYRDCLDTFTLGREILFTDNICLNTGVVIADIKTIYRDSGDEWGSSDPTNVPRNIVIKGNYIEGNPLNTYESKMINILNEHIRQDNLFEGVEYGVFNIFVEGNKFFGDCKYPIYIRGSHSIQVVDNVFEGDFERTMWVRDGSKKIKITGNDITYLNPVGAGNAIVMNNVSNSVFNNNTIRALGGTGGYVLMQVVKGEDIGISNNTFEGNTDRGLIIKESKRVTVKSNVFRDFHVAGIEFPNSDKNNQELIVQGNSLYNCQRGMLLSSSNSKLLITNNSMVSCPTPFSNADAPINSLIENNSYIGHYTG